MYLMKCKVIYATPYIKQGCMKDGRLVVVKWYKSGGGVKEYSSHTQTKDGVLYQGAYFKSKDLAIKAVRNEMSMYPMVWHGKYLRSVDCKPMWM